MQNDIAHSLANDTQATQKSILDNDDYWKELDRRNGVTYDTIPENY